MMLYHSAALLFVSLISLTGSASGVFHTSFAHGPASNSFAFKSTRSSGRSAFQARAAREAHVTQAGLAKNLVRGAVLRIASDLSGGTPLESIKCRVTVTKENMFEAVNAIVQQDGILGLWSGTPSRTIEGALLGAVFMLGSTLTKKQALALGASKTVAALAGGMVGGVAQSVVSKFHSPYSFSLPSKYIDVFLLLNEYSDPGGYDLHKSECQSRKERL